MPAKLSAIVRKHQQTLVSEWIAEQKSVLSRKLMRDAELEEQCAAFLSALERGLADGETDSLAGKGWGEMKELLAAVSRTRGQSGHSPAETAMFVFSLKRPLFARISRELPPGDVAAEQWSATVLLDQLGLYTTEMYQR